MSEIREFSINWEKLAARELPQKLIDMPVYENGVPICQVIIKSLSHSDIEKIQKNALSECDRKFTSKEEKIDRESKHYRDMYDNIAAKHYLFTVCRDPENPKKRFFPTPDHIADRLTLDEMAVLMKHYRTLQDERGPLIGSMTSEMLDKYIEQIANNMEDSPYFLDRFLPEVVKELVMYMAFQLWNLRMDKSSSTSPQEDSIIEPQKV